MQTYPLALEYPKILAVQYYREDPTEERSYIKWNYHAKYTRDPVAPGAPS